MDSYEIEYEQTVEDIIALNRYLADHLPDGRKKPRTRLWALIPAVTLFVVVGTAGLIQSFLLAETIWQMIGRGVIWFFVILVVAYFLFARQLAETRLRRHFRKPENARILGPHRLQLDAFGLVVTGPIAQTSWKWDAIDRIQQTADYAFMFTIQGGAVVIPRTAFSKDGQFLTFVNRARRHHGSIKVTHDEDGR